jgi:hypothetical protein
VVRDFDGLECLRHDVTVSRTMGGEGAHMRMAATTNEALDREALWADGVLWEAGQDTGEGASSIILEAPAQHVDVSLAQVEVAPERANQSRFPRSVRPDESHDLAFGHAQGGIS